jgi:hypothetical protein
LQAELDAALRRFLADSRYGARYDAPSNTMYLSPLLRWFAGDFIQPWSMPGLTHLIAAWSQPQPLLDWLHPYLPSELTASLDQQMPVVRFLPFDWSLNVSIPAVAERTRGG